jgi:hypothetical protein
MWRSFRFVIAVGIVLLIISSCLEQTKPPPPSVKPISPAPVALPETADMPNNNRLCLICHLNFAENDSVAGHISQGITCAHCHGGSIDHMNDESMMTPPDILYGRIEVESMCKQCHRQDHKNPQAVVTFCRKWGGEKRENGRNVLEDSICTDCHGRHTIPRR